MQNDLKSRLAIAVFSGVCAVVLASCSEEPAHSVDEFVNDPRLLEATMVRCSRDRLELKYTANCINAREAVDRIAAREEAALRADREAESARKRDALRRARQAAEEARARAAEAERLQREAEYLGQFEPVTEGYDAGSLTPPAQPGSTNAPAAETGGPTDEDGSSATLEEVREELRKRQQ